MEPISHSVPYPTPPPESEDNIPKKKNPALTKLIVNAIRALDEKKGSSAVAIAKFIKSSNQYEIKDDQVFIKKVVSSIKMNISRGHVEQYKRSFRLTKTELKALEKGKEKKEKKKEKADAKMDKKKKKKDEPKSTANLAKVEKPKPSEKKTGQKARDGKSKKTAAGSRKSIGTLAQTKSNSKRPKLDRLSIHKVVASKDSEKGGDDVPNGPALAASTPHMATTKRKQAPKTKK